MLYHPKNKKVLLIFSLMFLLTLIVGLYLLSKEEIIQIPKKEMVSNFNNNQIEKAIINYLLKQKQFSWITTSNSSNHCAIKNLEPKNELFPLSIWVYCVEYKFEGDKLIILSGTSMPVKIFYPNVLSFYDLDKFTYEAPREGSDNGPDIERIFSVEARKNMVDSDALIERAKREIRENKENWDKILIAANNCEIKKSFQNHAREVTVILKNGIGVQVVEPQIDDIFKVIAKAGCKNKVEMATE